MDAEEARAVARLNTPNNVEFSKVMKIIWNEAKKGNTTICIFKVLKTKNIDRLKDLGYTVSILDCSRTRISW